MNKIKELAKLRREYMSKLVFFDIDGTIWDDNMLIPDTTVEAIRKLRANGHKAFLCSGRARASITAQNLLDIGFDGIIAACGTYIEMNGKVLYERLLSEETVNKILTVCREAKLPVVLEGPRDYWIDAKGFEEDPYIDYLFLDLGKHAHNIEGYEGKIEINKFSADVLKKTDYKRIKEVFSEEFNILEHTPVVIEFVPKGFSKKSGIEWLCKYLDVEMEDTYALGDSINDLEMLAAVGHGVAMGNGSKPAKEAAEYITTDIWDDGVRNALVHYGLI